MVFKYFISALFRLYLEMLFKYFIVIVFRQYLQNVNKLPDLWFRYRVAIVLMVQNEWFLPTGTF